MAKKKSVRADEPSTAAASSPRRRATTQPVGEPPPDEPTYDQIAEAAYHRYLQRGGQHGQDFDDWVEAERALKKPRP